MQFLKNNLIHCYLSTGKQRVINDDVIHCYLSNPAGNECRIQRLSHFERIMCQLQRVCNTYNKIIIIIIIIIIQ